MVWWEQSCSHYQQKKIANEMKPRRQNGNRTLTEDSILKGQQDMQVRYKNIDSKLVVNEIRNGRSLEAVQKLFGIKFKSEVQDLYLKGLMELGEIPQVDFSKPEGPAPRQQKSTQKTETEKVAAKPVVRRREKAAANATKKPALFIRTPNLRTIGQSGSVTLNKALLIEQLGFEVGDSFEICREDDRVVLNKIGSHR